MGQSASALQMDRDVPTFPEAGLFTWDLDRNVLYGDAALAALCGLDALSVKHGLPIERYLDRIHPQDRTNFARSIAEAIAKDRPQQDAFRVESRSGDYVVVACYGRSFGDTVANPKVFSGIIVPAATDAELLLH